MERDNVNRPFGRQVLHLNMIEVTNERPGLISQQVSLKRIMIDIVWYVMLPCSLEYESMIPEARSFSSTWASALLSLVF
jgi:hypothetical protein